MNNIAGLLSMILPFPFATLIFFTRPKQCQVADGHVYPERTRLSIIWVWPILAGALAAVWVISPLRRCPAAAVFGPWYLNAAIDGIWAIFAIQAGYMTLNLCANEISIRRLFFKRVIAASELSSAFVRYGRTVVVARDGKRMVIPASLIDPILLRSWLLRSCPSAELRLKMKDKR